MSPQEFELEVTQRLRLAGIPEPAMEARHLVREAFATNQSSQIFRWTERRIGGEPLAYLSGRKGFYKNDFFVEPGVLVPRPETEILVEVARLRGSKLKIENFADLGCGSGCLGLSLLLEIPASILWAFDISDRACSVTGKNTQALGLEARVQILCGDLLKIASPVPAFDLIVANPPYISLGDPQVQPSVHAHEPHVALYSGEDGLDAIRAWSRWSMRNLTAGGLFACEFGAGQTAAVRDIIEAQDFEDVQIQKDLAGIDRVVSAFKRGLKNG